jgi:hypothetical protein
MNQTELCELMSVHGFYRFLSEQTHLPTEKVIRIYLVGRPWGVWPSDIEVGSEAEAAGTDVFTYLVALKPLADMDRHEKEAQLAAHEDALAGGSHAEWACTMRSQVEKVAALAKEDEQTICNLLHALYGYRQRIGQLSILKMVQNKTAAISELQRVMAAELAKRREQRPHDSWN